MIPMRSVYGFCQCAFASYSHKCNTGFSYFLKRKKNMATQNAIIRITGGMETEGCGKLITTHIQPYRSLALLKSCL